MVKCSINGHSVEVEEGTSIIEAYKMVEQDIAHYCWHPGLSVAGVCRLCMVEIEGNPRLQIACNTVVQEGMVINNNSELVKDAVKWGLDFHLINHPLDCPICDQAGECGLQDQYMQFGKYDPEMGENKVKKQKVVDLGERVVLDSERCILCSRCVRFTEEISKTNELGIFNRGDHSEIGTFDGMPLDNNYSINTVDICPVGALTSKDFRFRQRVWFLEDKPSVCTGCSTGCNVNVYHNDEGAWRVKPRHSDVNGYWMCDEGRDIYKASNVFKTEFVGERGKKKTRKLPNRVTQATMWTDGLAEARDPKEALKGLASTLSSFDKKNVALVLTGQYTTEDLEAITTQWKTQYGVESIYHWWNHEAQADDFDDILTRGDKNPNTAGLKSVFEKQGIKTQWSGLEAALNDGTVDLLVVAGPENQWVHDDMEEKLNLFSKAKNWVYLTACWPEALDSIDKSGATFLPTNTALESTGHFTNFAGKAQKIEPVTIIVPGALSLEQVAKGFSGAADEIQDESTGLTRVKNEFVHKRGEL